MLCALIFKKSIKRYWNVKWQVNCVRKEFFYFIEKNNLREKRNMIDVYYRFDKNVVGALEIKFKLHFTKSEDKISTIKESCACATGLKSSNINNEKGYVSFFLFDEFVPLNKVYCDNTSVSIGTSFKGLMLWNWEKYPMALITGGIGQGKSNQMRYILSGLMSKKLSIYCVDGKGVDYIFYKNYFESYLNMKNNTVEDVINLIKIFHLQMKNRYELMEKLALEKNKKDGKIISFTFDTFNLEPVFLLLDEYNAIYTLASKNERIELDKYIGIIITLGRQAGFNIIYTTQRADATLIGGANRDNIKFKAVLGSASTESYKMMFDDKSGQLQPLRVGNAWVSMSDEVSMISIPFFDNVEGVNSDEVDVNVMPFTDDIEGACANETTLNE